MEEAVRVLGGAPDVCGGRGAARAQPARRWLLIFIPGAGPLPAIFYGPNTKVASVMIFDMSEEGNFEYLSALALILQLLTLPLLWLGQRALGRDFMLRRTAT
jgi:iron(III) transport system permease protein